MRRLTLGEVSQHKTAQSCWVIIGSTVYDVTKFLPDHPGGSRSILRFAGKDATTEFEGIHPPGTLEETLHESAKVGTVESVGGEDTPGDRTDMEETAKLAPETPEDMLNIADIEDHASRTLSNKAWAYYASASDDMRTKIYNNTIFHLVLFRPRIFRDITVVDTTAHMLGFKTSLPLFVSPAALARLAHPDGEKAIARACGKHGIVQMISNNASLRYADIVSAAVSSKQPFAFQLYIQNERARSEKQLREVVKAGCKAVVLTLDAPTPGKREMDERVARQETRAAGHVEVNEALSASSGRGKVTEGGVGRALFQGTAGDLVWDDLIWLRKQLPDDIKIVLKGLQTVEDVILATQQFDKTNGKPLVDAVLLSNHGGRALEGAPPPLLVLQELRMYAPEVFQKLEVYIDGGIRRGTDVVKALCLGATQVGIGRPALMALAGGFGEAGVSRVIQILREEIETAMRLLGALTLDQLGPQYVNTRQLDAILGPSPQQAAAPRLHFSAKL
ncbi:FMN-dependent dehydrogenase-domain-containing protein [Lipomyces kononenkoae]|uniref:FMN-dependent dehydrogenase-domain-containing protein n=1 Tax=Lipomyces kononenkoae TaxID=34357 RepID=A0ACC3SZS9_LIPKO